MISTHVVDLKILVVDDDDWNVAYIYEVLRAFGFTNIHGLTDGRLALDYIRNEPVDLVLLDLLMPEFSGFEVLKRIKEMRSEIEYLPVLVITSGDEEESRRKAMELGATDYLPKPFEEIVMVSRVSNLLRARQLQLKLHGRAGRTGFEEEMPNFTREQLAELLADSPAGVVLLDQDERILLSNQQFCDLFSIPANPLVLEGESWTDAVEGLKEDFVDPQGYEDRISEILAGRQPVDHEVLHLQDGRTFERDYVPFQFFDGNRGHLWIFRDVSER